MRSGNPWGSGPSWVVWLLNAVVLLACLLWVYGLLRGDPAFRGQWAWIAFLLSMSVFNTWLWSRARRKPPVARSPEPPSARGETR